MYIVHTQFRIHKIVDSATQCCNGDTHLVWTSSFHGGGPKKDRWSRQKDAGCWLVSVQTDHIYDEAYYRYICTLYLRRGYTTARQYLHKYYLHTYIEKQVSFLNALWINSIQKVVLFNFKYFFLSFSNPILCTTWIILLNETLLIRVSNFPFLKPILFTLVVYTL